LANYLVTGAAGFIGRSIAAALLKRGDNVRGVDSFITGKRANLTGLEAMEFIDGDLADPAVCAKACAGVEVVFHEAALASVPRSVADPAATNRNCVDATVNLLVAARAAGARRVMYAGSSSVYGDTPTLPKREDMLPNPISPYAVAKLAGEHYMSAFTRVYGLETVTLRYFNVFGPFQDPTSHYSGVLAIFCRKLLAGEQPTIYGDGEQSRDFTFIENVVAANLLAADAPAEKVSGKMMNVATGAAVTLNQVFEILRELTGYSGNPAYAEPRSGDIKHSLADISRARELLGYVPQVDFREGIAAPLSGTRICSRTIDVSPLPAILLLCWSNRSFSAPSAACAGSRSNPRYVMAITLVTHPIDEWCAMNETVRDFPQNSCSF
jgi:nucleoside-diphosphate-sugar epimerase